MSNVSEMVEFVTRQLVDAPDAVYVHEQHGETTLAVEVTVADEDMGRVIGRQGRTINALRALSRVLGAKQGMRVSLELYQAEAT